MQHTTVWMLLGRGYGSLTSSNQKYRTTELLDYKDILLRTD